jgi:ribonuclease P protein component
VVAWSCRGAAPRAASDSVRKPALREPPTTAKLGFEPRKRLHQPAEFRAVRQRGQRLSDAFFSLSILANREAHARLGLAISTRAAGSSVARNRLKRLARESFRVNQHALPGVDVTVAARDAARGATARALRASLEQHWKTISERW